MPRLSADQWAAKLATRAGNAGQDWLTGVQNPSRDPVKAAIAAEAKWKAKTQEAINKGTWAKKMAKVTAADIIATATKVGTQAYTNGIAARTDKIAAAGARILPQIYKVADTVAAMPDVTDADRDARMLANVKGLRAIKGT